MPHLKASYAKYQNDPGVAFLLVSIDEDTKRLQRYLNEAKFPFPVARVDAGHAQQMMRFDNTPSTFYVDRGGIVLRDCGLISRVERDDCLLVDGVGGSRHSRTHRRGDPGHDRQEENARIPS